MGWLVRIDVVQAPLCARFSFVSYSLQVHPYSEDVDGATRFYHDEVGRSLTPPLTPESAAELGDLQMRALELDLDEMSQVADISISGLDGYLWVRWPPYAKSPSEGMRTVIDGAGWRANLLRPRCPSPDYGMSRLRRLRQLEGFYVERWCSNAAAAGPRPSSRYEI